MASESWRRNHRQRGWGNPTLPTIAMSAERCSGCQWLMAQALVDLGLELHPCCSHAGPIRRHVEQRPAEQSVTA